MALVRIDAHSCVLFASCALCCGHHRSTPPTVLGCLPDEWARVARAAPARVPRCVHARALPYHVLVCIDAHSRVARVVCAVQCIVQCIVQCRCTALAVLVVLCSALQCSEVSVHSSACINDIVVACIRNQKSRGKGTSKPTSKRATPSLGLEGKSVREERSGEGKRMRKVVTFDTA